MSLYAERLRSLSREEESLRRLLSLLSTSTLRHDPQADLPGEVLKGIKSSRAFRGSLMEWKMSLVDGSLWTTGTLDLSQCGESLLQSVLSKFDERLAGSADPGHWLPSSSGQVRQMDSPISKLPSDAIGILMEERDGFLSLFVRYPFDEWKRIEIDNLPAYHYLYEPDHLGVIADCINYDRNKLAASAQFFSNSSLLLEGVSLPCQIGRAVPVPGFPGSEAVYADLSCDALDLFIPCKGTLLRRRIPSLGLSKVLHEELEDAEIRIILEVLLLDKPKYDKQAKRLVSPKGVEQQVVGFCETFAGLVSDVSVPVCLSGWFGTPLIQRYLSGRNTLFDFPDFGMITTWHRILSTLQQTPCGRSSHAGRP